MIRAILLILFSSSSFALDFSVYNSALMLLVEKQNGATYVCSSVAIASRKLLTAAHCLSEARSIKVIKEHRQTKSNTYLMAKSFHKHPLYDKRKSNFNFDIGLIVLSEEVDPSIRIYPLKKFDASLKQELHRVGFGGRDGQNTRTVVFPLESPRMLANNIKVVDRFSFSGDSGGPIYAFYNGKKYVVGVHSTKEGIVSYNPSLDQQTIEWIKAIH